MRRSATGWLFTLLLAVFAPCITADNPEIRHVVLVTMDGVRVQEMFGGMDAQILAHGLESWERLEDSPAYKAYAGPTREERRRRLMPFFWDTLMRDHGFIVGDPQTPARERLLNQRRYSYPGYSEILTGHADDARITGNNIGRNPNPSVLERLRAELGLSPAQVAVFASWATMRDIVEHTPGTLLVNAGHESYATRDPAVAAVNRLQNDVPTESSATRADACTFELALAHLRTHHPAFLYMAFDETDTLAHAGRYADVLDAMARTDRWLRRLWNVLQSDAEYRNHTVLVFTVDHGRGELPSTWSQHGDGVVGAENVWTAYVVPGGKRRGVLNEPRTFVHAQLAATLAGFLGVDYRRYEPAAAPALATYY
jgi:hypothetical protein